MCHANQKTDRSLSSNKFISIEFQTCVWRLSTEEDNASDKEWAHYSAGRGDSFVYRVVYKKTKGDGARKLAYRIRKWYYGRWKGTIQKWIGSNHQSTRKRPLFQNKAPLRTIRSKTVNSRHQLDLVDLSPISENVRKVTYRYVLSIQDVFSRHLWLRPLSDKTAKSVMQTVKSLYLDWCFPKIVQTDQGGEFKGQFDRFCK